MLVSGIVLHAQVGVNANGAPPNPSAALDLDFSDKGLLMPRLSTSERNQISNPAKGLMIYNTDCDNVNFNAGTPESPDWVVMNSSNSLVAGVTISANPVGALCQGTPVTYSASITNGGTSPTYQWRKNGADIPGEDGATYTNTSPVNGDQITCVITSNAACVTGSPATSIAITEVVNPTLPASVSIAVNPAGSVCEGTTLSFTALGVNTGPSPTYQWVRNGLDIPGATGSLFVSSTLEVGDAITCVMTSNQSCVTGSPAISNEISPNVIDVATASVSISQSPSGTVCSGSSVTFTATPVNGGTSPTYQWKKDGEDISGATSAEYITSSLADGEVITCEMISNQPCVQDPSVLSNEITADVSGGAGSQTFAYTGSSQTFTVPACVTSITFQAWGAQGNNSTGASPGIGGLGGYATGSLSVTPGQQFQVNVGGQNGWNGGGNFGGNGQCGEGPGGVGGGASDIRSGGTSLSDRILVAGGGGGGGAAGNCSFAAGGAGGEGGGTTGGNGVQNYNWGQPVGGRGGSQSAGGAGALSCDISNLDGLPGSFGVGGDARGRYSSGGGGGGGYYGGGGGGTCSSGAGGGGGSSYTGGVNGGSTQGGQRSGNGEVHITW